MLMYDHEPYIILHDYGVLGVIIYHRVVGFYVLKLIVCKQKNILYFQ